MVRIMGCCLTSWQIVLAHSAYITVLDRFKNNRNLRVALLTLKAAFSGKAVWEKSITESDNFPDNHKWNGTTDITLEIHLTGHREEYTFFIKSADHVQHQIPPEQILCSKCIELFDCNDPKMPSGLAVVENEKIDIRGDFEACAAYLIPMNPVAINKAKADSKKKISVMFSAVSFDPKLKNLKGE